jgi:hypothetical protein
LSLNGNFLHMRIFLFLEHILSSFVLKLVMSSIP